MHLNVTGNLNKQMGVSIAGVPGESDPPNGLIEKRGFEYERKGVVPSMRHWMWLLAR